MSIKLLKWEKGRQKTGYEKLTLAFVTSPFKFDIYLLKFPEGCEVPPHTDIVSYGRHYRLNIVLKKAKLGGDFVCKNPIFCSDRIKFFRPDLCEHSVTKVKSGNRYLLSIGWVKDDILSSVFFTNLAYWRNHLAYFYFLSFF